MAERLPPAPDVIDHRMIGVGGGIDVVDRRRLRKVPGQIEGELHAGRGARFALVDRDLEEVSAALVAKESPQATGLPPCDKVAISNSLAPRAPCGVMDEAAVAVMLGERRAAIGFPAFRFQCQKSLERRCDLFRRARHAEFDRAEVGQAVALAAKLFQFFRSKRVAQQGRGIGARIETRALISLMDMRADIAAGEGAGDRGRGRTILREILKQESHRRRPVARHREDRRRLVRPRRDRATAWSAAHKPATRQKRGSAISARARPKRPATIRSGFSARGYPRPATLWRRRGRAHAKRPRAPRPADRRHWVRSRRPRAATRLAAGRWRDRQVRS